MPGLIRCFEYICLDFGTVRSVLATGTAGLSRAAATMAEHHAYSFSRELASVSDTIPPATRVLVSCDPLVDSDPGSGGLRSSTMRIQWEMETSSGIRPLMTGLFVIRELTSTTTHLEYKGICQILPPAGTISGTAVNHWIAERSAQQFVRTVAEGLTEHFASSPHDSRAPGSEEEGGMPAGMSEIDLRQSLSQQQALVAKMQRTNQDERARFAREIHDQLGSALTGLKWDLEWLISIARSETPGPKRTHVLDRLTAMVALTVDTMGTVRSITSGLRAPLMDANGLVASIEHRLGELRQRSGIQTAFLGQDALSALTQVQASAAYQIVSEALTNVLRHASASRVEVSCWHHNAKVCISISDDGIGMQPASPRDLPGFGILGMKERAGMVGGTLDFPATLGKGTQILVRIPLE